MSDVGKYSMHVFITLVTTQHSEECLKEVVPCLLASVIPVLFFSL